MNPLAALLQKEFFQHPSRQIVELGHGNAVGMEEGDRMHRAVDPFAKGLREATQAQRGLGSQRSIISEDDAE